MNCPQTGKECPASEECPWWVKLTAGNEEHGRCAVAWLPVLLVELRGAIVKGMEAPCTANDDKKK